jgi:DNA-binding transcriptional LysR family regulator
MNWDDLRYFLAVARSGAMSRAARSLEVAQPTVGRRIAAFEKKLGAKLFVRDASGMLLSDAGQALFTHAERMERHALEAENIASGRDLGIAGRVRITASEWLVTSVIGPALEPLVSRHPALEIVLAADPRHLSLVRRDADIALRPSQFTEVEVFQRQVGVIEFALYASEEYLERHGPPDFARGAAGHVIIGMTDDMRTIVDVEWLPSLVGRARVAVRANGREPMARMAASGIGIACLPRLVGDAMPTLTRLRTPSPHPRRKLWLGVHRASRTIPRIRATLDFLVEHFVVPSPKKRLRRS